MKTKKAAFKFARLYEQTHKKISSIAEENGRNIPETIDRILKEYLERNTMKPEKSG